MLAVLAVIFPIYCTFSFLNTFRSFVKYTPTDTNSAQQGRNRGKNYWLVLVACGATLAATGATCSACFYCWEMFLLRCAIVSCPGVSFQALFCRTNYDSVNVCAFVNREILTKSPRFCVSRCIYCVLTSCGTIHNIRYALSCTNRAIVKQSGRAVGLSLCVLWVRAGGGGGLCSWVPGGKIRAVRRAVGWVPYHAVT